MRTYYVLAEFYVGSVWYIQMYVCVDIKLATILFLIFDFH